MDFETFLEIFPLKNIIIYLVVINIVGFLAMFIDKEKAKRGAWRIPEKNTFFTYDSWRGNWYNNWNVFI